MAQPDIYEGRGGYVLVYIRTVVLWDTTPCSHVESDAKFRGNYLPSFSVTKKIMVSVFPCI